MYFWIGYPPLDVILVVDAVVFVSVDVDSQSAVHQHRLVPAAAVAATVLRTVDYVATVARVEFFERVLAIRGGGGGGGLLFDALVRVAAAAFHASLGVDGGLALHGYLVRVVHCRHYRRIYGAAAANAVDIATHV